MNSCLCSLTRCFFGPHVPPFKWKYNHFLLLAIASYTRCGDDCETCTIPISVLASTLSLRNLTESSPALGSRHEIYNREIRPVDDQHNDDEAEFITCVVFSIFCAMYILRDEGREPRSTLAHSFPLSAAFPTGQLYACIIFHTNKTDRMLLLRFGRLFCDMLMRRKRWGSCKDKDLRKRKIGKFKFCRR